MVRIAGFKGAIEDPEEMLTIARESCKGDVQLFRADMVFGQTHLKTAADHAIRSIKEGRNSSSSVATETMLYAAGTRQIVKAIEKMGIRYGDSEIALVAFRDFDVKRFEEKTHFRRDDSVLEGDVEMLREFGITGKEVAAVGEQKAVDLVLERVALVDLL